MPWVSGEVFQQQPGQAEVSRSRSVRGLANSRKKEKQCVPGSPGEETTCGAKARLVTAGFPPRVPRRPDCPSTWTPMTAG